MKSSKISGITLTYDAPESETAVLIGSAIKDSLRLAEELWGLKPPANCRVYVMTAWFRFFFQSAPWPWKLLLGSTLPFWMPRARRTWPYSAGWTQRYGKHVAIGIKTPALLEKSDKSVGMHMFVEEKDASVKIRHLTCHELVHACAAHLRLPAWLNEGTAALTVDRCLGKQTIRQDTLELIRDFQPQAAPPTYLELSRLRGKELAYHAVRGYWLVRYLEEMKPGFLKEAFSKPVKIGQMDVEIAARLGVEPQILWSTVDSTIFSYFSPAEK
jgi:hypothetical protein